MIDFAKNGIDGHQMNQIMEKKRVQRQKSKLRFLMAIQQTYITHTRTYYIWTCAKPVRVSGTAGSIVLKFDLDWVLEQLDMPFISLLALQLIIQPYWRPPIPLIPPMGGDGRYPPQCTEDVHQDQIN